MMIILHTVRIVYIVKIGFVSIIVVSIASSRIPRLYDYWDRRFLLGLTLFLPSTSVFSFTHLSFPIFPFFHSEFLGFSPLSLCIICSFAFVLYIGSRTILCRVYSYFISSTPNHVSTFPLCLDCWLTCSMCFGHAFWSVYLCSSFASWLPVFFIPCYSILSFLWVLSLFPILPTPDILVLMTTKPTLRLSWAGRDVLVCTLLSSCHCVRPFNTSSALHRPINGYRTGNPTAIGRDTPTAKRDACRPLHHV